MLADVRGLARRVRLTQRVTWLPLLVLGVVVLGAIPVYLLSRPTVSDCHPAPGGEVCQVWYAAAENYWLAAVIVAYAVITAGHLRVARRRGVSARAMPYAIAGGLLALALYVTTALGAGGWIFPDAALTEPSTFTMVVFRLLSPTGGIGLALLLLAWLERNPALLGFTALYLLVVLAPVDFGWTMMSQFQFVPMLVISGGLLLLGAAGFALTRHLRPAR
jgi:hypothetical protein